VIQNDKIIQSYPKADFVGFDTSSLFTDYLVEIDGMNLMLLEFFINQYENDDRSIVLAVPPDIFVQTNTIFGGNYKMIASSPVDNNRILYESEGMGGKESGRAVVFSNNQKQNSINLVQTTELVGYNRERTVVLQYLIWNSIFEKQFTVFGHIMLGTGIAVSFIVPAMFIRSEKLNERLKSTNKKLRQYTEKLREVDMAKEEFSSMITHELKTPLVPIQGYCEMLLNGVYGEVAPKQRQKIQIIHNNASRLLGLIQDVLDAHKLELGKMKLDMKEISARELVTQCINTFKPTMTEKNVALVDGVDSELRLKCDPRRLLQVLNNLTSNAVKFVPEQTGRIEISVRRDNGSLLFSVKDNGIGIPKEKQQYLFKKFYQVDTSLGRTAGGTGLGLAICRGIVEAHNGKIWVESEEGKGSTFYFSIPIGELEQ